MNTDTLVIQLCYFAYISEYVLLFLDSNVDEECE